MKTFKNIIVINGTGGAGKDTFISFAQNYAEVMNVSSIDKVKKVGTLIGWQGTKTEKDRKFLSDLKRLTTEYNDMSYLDIRKKVKKFMESSASILFIHIREPEEIARIVKDLGALTLIIKRPDIPMITSNFSDANVENYNYDFTVINYSPQELDKEAQNFVNTISNYNPITKNYNKLERRYI